MPQIRPQAELVFDNAHADGRVELQGFGIDWPFHNLEQERSRDERAWKPAYLHNGTEIVPGINALTLQGTSPLAAMPAWDTGQWQPVPASAWYRMPVPEWPPVDWYVYGSSEANTYGEVISTRNFYPRICVYLREFMPPADQTQTPGTVIRLLGAPPAPIPPKPPRIAYWLWLPVHTRETGGEEDEEGEVVWPEEREPTKYPELWRSLSYYQMGETPKWSQVAVWQRSGMAQTAQEGDFLHRVVWMEEADGVLLIRISGADDYWIVDDIDPKSVDQEPFRAQIGPVAVRFIGHGGAVNLQQISYPQVGTARAAGYSYILESTNPVAQSVASVGGEGAASNCTVSFQKVGARQLRPVISLTRKDPDDPTKLLQPWERPLCYVVHQYHGATFAGAESAPISTEARGLVELTSLKWTRKLHRDWEFNAELLDHADFYDGYLRPNMKVDVYAGADGVTTQIMEAYLDWPQFNRAADSFQGQITTLSLHGRDYIMARLADKKFWLHGCSPEGWGVDEWITWNLRKAGFPGTVIVPDGHSFSHKLLKQLPFDYDNDADLVKVLDEVLVQRNWHPLSVNAAGAIWTQADAGYGGTPDYVLDEATATGDDMIYRAEIRTEGDDFRNAAAILSADQATHVDYWPASLNDPTDDSFIGDLWWVVSNEPDCLFPALRAAQLRWQHQRAQRTFTWERNTLLTSLLPGHYVQVTIGNLDVPAGSIFRVIQEEGEVNTEQMTGKSSFTLEFIPPDEYA